MKKTIYIIFIFLGLISCNNKNTKEVSDTSALETKQSIAEDKKQDKIYIKDKTQYDQSFINGLSEYNEPLKLIENCVLVGKDTIYFPEDLKLNKKTIFKGTNKKFKFELMVARTNYTNINYEFKLTDKNNKIADSKSGKAILGSLFFLAPEGDDDLEMNDGYGSYEYWDNANNCSFSIRIGIGLDGNGKQRAKIIYGCKDKNKQKIDLDECPTLRTE